MVKTTLSQKSIQSHPISLRMLFSQICEKTQRHRCILEGQNPSLIIGDSDYLLPFVLEEQIEEQTQCGLFPLYPPPTPSATHANLYSSSLKVVNLQKSGKSSSKAEALLFNPLVTKILIKSSALKRVSHAERKSQSVASCIAQDWERKTATARREASPHRGNEIDTRPSEQKGMPALRSDEKEKNVAAKGDQLYTWT